MQTYEALFFQTDEMIEQRGIPTRCAGPLFDAAVGQVITSQSYRREAGVGGIAASEDLRRLAKAKLLVACGEWKGRSYEAGSQLKSAWESLRSKTPLSDPYELLRTDIVLGASYLADARREL